MDKRELFEISLLLFSSFLFSFSIKCHLYVRMYPQDIFLFILIVVGIRIVLSNDISVLKIMDIAHKICRKYVKNSHIAQ